jgi:Asp-tRNA(Asn)/Glu-tRNA(Gln) amidotransferase C subunit
MKRYLVNPGLLNKDELVRDFNKIMKYIEELQELIKAQDDYMDYIAREFRLQDNITKGVF